MWWGLFIFFSTGLFGDTPRQSNSYLLNRKKIHMVGLWSVAHICIKPPFLWYLKLKSCANNLPREDTFNLNPIKNQRQDFIKLEINEMGKIQILRYANLVELVQDLQLLTQQNVSLCSTDSRELNINENHNFPFFPLLCLSYETH